MKKTIFITLLIIIFWGCMKNPQNFYISKNTKTELVSKIEEYIEIMRRPSPSSWNLNESPAQAALRLLSKTNKKIDEISAETEIFNILKNIKDDFEKRGYKPEDFKETQYGAWLDKFKEYVKSGRDFSQILKLKRAAEAFQIRTF